MTTQVLGVADTPEALWIRWSNGKEQIVPITANSWDITVRPE
jgi:acyl transferase domain-containing protein